MARKKSRLGDNPLDWIKSTGNESVSGKEENIAAAPRVESVVNESAAAAGIVTESVQVGAPAEKPGEKTVIKAVESMPEPATRPLTRIDILNRLKSGDLDPTQALQLINQAQEQKKSHQLMAFQSQWQEAPLAFAPGPGEPIVPGDMTVFDNDTRLADALRRRLTGHRLALVKPGAAYAEKDNLVFEIDAANPEHYLKLVERLVQLGVKPVYLVHRWSSGAFSMDLPDLVNQLNAGFYSLFYLGQALLTHKVGPAIRLLYVYPIPQEGASPAYAAVSGFACSVRRENPGFLVKTLGLPVKEDPAVSLVDLLLAELDIHGDQDIDVRYHKNYRQIHRYLPSTPQTDGRPIPLKKGGVYIVTGGAGGLGMIFFRYLVERFSARVVLVGRSGLSPEKQGQIDRLRQSGADVTYTGADISQPQEVEQLIRDVKARFKTIDGVIHSAGVNRDAFLLTKTRAQIDEVLAAKVFGTVCLAQALEQDPPGVFVLFSSGAAVMGNAGQCDYAFANSFMDHFAQWRRNRHPNSPILSINWPLWQEGGMRIPQWEQQQLFQQTGLAALPTQLGLDAWETALRTGACRYIAFYGEGRFRGYFDPPVKRQGNHHVKEKTQTFLKEIFSELFCLPPGKLDVARTFQEYGVDSIIVNQFNAKMETHLGPLSKTLLYEYRTIKELIDYFMQHHEATLVNFFGLREDVPGDPGISLKQPGPTLPSPSNRGITGPGAASRQEKGAEAAGEQEDIAVIGMSGRYAFAPNLEEFWRNLLDGKDCITEVPAHRWDLNAYYDPDPAKAREGKMYCKWGSFLEDADKFDPLFFSISPREAETMDPQERLFLEIAWSALEDAGYSRTRLHRDIPQNQGANVGVFAGVTSYTYLLWGPDEWRKGNNVIPNSVPWTIANRVSYVFDLNGPSLPVDTACSSSLTAVHMACESLKRGECNMAIAGGVNLYLHPSKYIAMCQVNMLSPTGRCHSFGAAGDGFVPGEGVGALVLKPISLAHRDGDRIYAVIKGSSINHGGATSGYTVPNPNAQAQLILETIKKARLNPRAISYIEAHGTGTRLGDPIEITGLSKAFRHYTPDNQFCAIGSIKSNIGHLEAAAGIAGLTRIILQMKHKQLAPSLHSQPLNPNIDFTTTPFTVQQHLADWDRPVIEENGRRVTHPRIAGISSFGAGGANAHIILQEYGEGPANTGAERPGPQLFILSARTEERLKVYAGEIAAHLGKTAAPEVKNPLPGFYSRLREDLVRAVAEIIAVEYREINPGDHLADIGVDGVKQAALADRLAETYGLDITPPLFSQHPSPDSLAGYLLDTHGDALAAHYGQPPAPKKAGQSRDLHLAADTAYTLQVGREPLDHRLALAATHLDELKEKLSHYAQGNTGIEGLYTGSAAVGKERALLVLDGEEGREFLHTLIRNNKLDKLAQLWASGVTVDWTLLPRQGQPGIISLPTYPFEKKRYWLGNKKSVPGAGGFSTVSGPGIAPLHPLLDANVSTLEEQRYIKILTGSEFFLTDHVVKEKKILPGVAYLEMARAAGDMAQPRGRVTLIKNVVWQRPLIIENEPLPIFVGLFPESGAVAFEISGGEGDTGVVYAHGALEYSEVTGPPRGVHPDAIDIQAIGRRCTRRLEGDECYRMFRQLGFHYGPGFRPIRWLASGSGEALAFLELPEPCKKDFSHFKLHPSLLDGALQSAAGLFLDDAAGLGALAAYIPFSIGEVRLISPGSVCCYAYATLSEPGQSRTPGGVTRFNISLVDEKGQEWAILKDYTVRPAINLESLSQKNNTEEKEDIFRKLHAGAIDVQAAKKLLGVQS